MGLYYLLPEKIASHTLDDLKSKLSEFRVLSVFTSKSFTLLDRTCAIQEQPGDEREQTHPNKSRRSFVGNKSFYIPLFTMLKIVKTLPVSSCEAEIICTFPIYL